jgi:L-alanine-DL-glutamate epimerase-like enolase superfamily enzyme
LKIANIESFLMSCPMSHPIKLPFYGGERTILKRDAMLIRVTANNGLKGFAPGPAHVPAREDINGIIRTQLLGEDISKTLKNPPLFEHQIRKNYDAVEFALFDLQAKIEGVPLSEMLGGRIRDRIKLYGSAGMYMSPKGYAEEAAAIADMGFSAYKMRPALGPEGDLCTVELMRKAVGPDVGLMIDAHAWWRMGDKNYTFETVEQLAKSMSSYSPYWLEEPLPPDDHDLYRKLTSKNIVPIASGEHEQTDDGFLDLIQTNAVNFVQMDAFCQGGLKSANKIFQSVQDSGLKFAYHSWGTMLEVLVASHLGICWPEHVVEWLEHPNYSNSGRLGMYPFALSDEILKGPLPIEKGELVVPDSPGIGIDVDESVVEKYPFIPGPWSVFEIYSPPEKIAVTGDHSIKWVNGKEI